MHWVPYVYVARTPEKSLRLLTSGFLKNVYLFANTAAYNDDANKKTCLILIMLQKTFHLALS